MHWISVPENYLSYLRTSEKRIPNSDYGTDKFKPFFSPVFEVGDLVYVTQVSSAKPRHRIMTNKPDFKKIYDPKSNKLIAVVNFNYMFPVPKSLILNVTYSNIDSYRTFSSDAEKNSYIALLKKERRVINEWPIERWAKSIYENKYLYPDDQVSIRCFDFKKLESLANNYGKTGNQEQES